MNLESKYESKYMLAFKITFYSISTTHNQILISIHYVIFPKIRKLNSIIRQYQTNFIPNKFAIDYIFYQKICYNRENSTFASLVKFFGGPAGVHEINKVCVFFFLWRKLFAL